MCYGSGCQKEDCMGECRVLNFEPYRKTEFHSPCILYGCTNDVIEFYLTTEEHERLFELYKIGKLEQCNELEKIAWKRWEDDGDRKKVIEEIEKLSWLDR